MGVIVGSVGVVMIVTVIMPAAAGSMVVCVIMAVAMAAAFVAVRVIVIMIVPATLAFAAGVFRAHGGQIEDAQDQQADAGRQDHGTENAIRRQVGCDTARDIEVKHHTAPEKQQGNAH